MSNDLILSKSVIAPVAEDEARAAFRKSASRLGKAFINKKGEVVVQPRSAINRLKIRTEVDQNRSGANVVTYSGKVGISFPFGLLWFVFVTLMILTFVGIIVVIFVARSSRKITASTFKDATTSALEALS